MTLNQIPLWVGLYWEIATSWGESLSWLQLIYVPAHHQNETLKESMDLGYEDIDDIFERAALEWNRAKTGESVREVTPEDELEEWCDGNSL